MRFPIKQYLIQEGVLDGLQNNWGKLLVAGIGIAAAHSGALGQKAQHDVDSGGAALKGFLDKAGNGAKQMADFYKKQHPEAANKLDTAIQNSSDKIDQFKQDHPGIQDNIAKASSSFDNKLQNIDQKPEIKQDISKVANDIKSIFKSPDTTNNAISTSSQPEN